MATRYEEQLWQGDVATMAMLKEIRETGRELVAPHEKVRFVGIDGDHEAPGALKLAITTESGEIEVPMQRWALQQACGRVEPVDDETGKRSTRQAVPFAYIDKLVTAGGFKLAADNLNFWAAKTAERVSMIRVWAKGVRAWVSDRFRPIDNYDLAITALKSFAKTGTVEIRKIFADERKLYIQAIRRDVSFDLDELAGNERPRPAGEHYDDGSADVFHPMVTISNSDTGHGRLSVRAGLWRMICKNGIVAEKEFAQIHLGRAHDASGDFLSTETIAAGNEQLFREIGDFIVHALNREVMLEVGQKLGVLKGVDIKDKSKKVVETRIAPQLELDEDETQALIDRYLHEAEEHGPNGYAMLNAVTWLAHEQEDPRRGLEYEEVAGKLIESPALLEV